MAMNGTSSRSQRAAALSLLQIYSGAAKVCFMLVVIRTVTKKNQVFSRSSVTTLSQEMEKESKMSDHGYEGGRLNLPFVGICTFGKYPYVEDWNAIDADVAVLGAPYDFGCQWRSGARMGPRAIREASTLFSFGHAGAYDHEDDITYLEPSKVKIVDIGDADIIHTDTMKSHANIEYGVRKILSAGAIPVVMGGDHSVNIPCINAFDDQGPIHVVQIDAHLDFVDERHGVRYGHGNPMRRAAEKPYVTGLSQIGIRNVSSTARGGYVDARKMGSDIQSVRQVRKLGIEGMLDRIPEGVNYYLTIDIDAFDPSIAPGTGTPSHGGFIYYEVLELIDGLARRGSIVGVDLVEVAPDYDQTGCTSTLAAQILMNTIGRILHHR
jgi:agmatinase